jgi:hypothetical protein
MTMAQFLNAAHSGKPPSPRYKFATHEQHAEWRRDF